MMIKDLEMTKALSQAELAGVRGGMNAGLLMGPTQGVGGGFSFASPVIQVAPQTVTQVETNVDLSSVFASMNTALGQTKSY